MLIDIKQAVMYPFHQDRWKHTILFPGLVQFANFLISFLINMFTGGLSFLTAMQHGSANEASANLAGTMVEGLSSILSLGVLVVFATIFLGYQWAFYQKMVTQDFEADPPEWSMEGLFQFIGLGLKSSCYYAVVGTAVAIAVAIPCIIFVIPIIGWLIGFLYLGIITIVLILSTPYWMTPLLITAHNHSLGDMFNFPKLIQMTNERYGQLMLGFLLCFALGIAYMVGAMILTITCIGLLAVPFLLQAVTVMCLHIWAQAFYKTETGNGGGNGGTGLTPQPITPSGGSGGFGTTYTPSTTTTGTTSGEYLFPGVNAPPPPSMASKPEIPPVQLPPQFPPNDNPPPSAPSSGEPFLPIKPE